MLGGGVSRSRPSEQNALRLLSDAEADEDEEAEEDEEGGASSIDMADPPVLLLLDEAAPPPSPPLLLLPLVEDGTWPKRRWRCCVMIGCGLGRGSMSVAGVADDSDAGC